MTWSTTVAACRQCNSTARPHHAKGLCRTCYQAQPDYRARYNESKAAKRRTPEGRAKIRAHYERNREAAIERVMARYWADAGYRFSLRIANLNYRARLAGCTDTITPEQALARVAYFGDRCYMCGGDWEHFDHVKPLSAGGPNLASNIRPACAGCNVRKHNNWDGAAALTNA